MQFKTLKLLTIFNISLFLFCLNFSAASIALEIGDSLVKQVWFALYPHVEHIKRAHMQCLYSWKIC